MSNFKVLNADLDTIFMSISTPGATGAQFPTNFIVSGQDLQLRYAKWVSGLKVHDTLYVARQHYGTDLSQIFQNIAVPLSNFVVTGTNYTITGSTDLTGITYITWISGTGSIIINNAPVSNSISITGGGAGGYYGNYSYWSDTLGGNGGNGGGAGSNIINTITLTTTTYNISVGNGGAAGTMPINSDGSIPSPIVAPINGQSSNFGGYTGNGGLINTGGAGGIGVSANPAPLAANGGAGTGYNGGGGGGGNGLPHPGGDGGSSTLGLGKGGDGTGKGNGYAATSSTGIGAGGNGGGGAAPSAILSHQYNSGGNGSAGIIGQVYLIITY
jgi:hypothetical protein